VTIIIETPAPPTRERLVLVPPGTCTDYVDKPGLVRLVTTDARDATAADLERAGYVTGEMLAEHVRIVWAAGQEAEPAGVAMLRRLKDRAEKAERERDEEKRHAGDAADALARLMRERDTLRAELARLTLVDEEEPTDAALRDAFAEGERKRDARHVASPLRIVYRLGVAHERARQPERVPHARVIRIVRAGPSEASATLETARRRLAAVAESMTEHAYQEMASALEVDACRVEPSEASAVAGALEAIAHLRADLRDAVNERDDLRHHYDAAGPEHNLLALLDSYESDADTARAQASAAYAMVVAAIGSVGAETIEAAVARLVADRGALVARAEKAERERDEALLRAHTGVVHYEILRQSGEESARQRDEARAELARLTAPGEGSEGEPTDNDLRDVWGPESTMANARRAIYRLGVAHERARHAAPVSSTPVTSDRATEDELEELYATAYARAHGRADEETLDKGEYAGLRAVAARVRQECLVAQAVARNADFHVTECMGGRWRVVVTDRDVNSKTELCAPSDVPATLARLLGEVSRG